MTLGERLWKVYWWLERNLAPGVQYAQRFYEDALFKTVRPDCRWLDLGCGHTLLPPWRAAAEQKILSMPRKLVGLDPDLASLRRHRAIRSRVCSQGGQLPFPDGEFDLVTANMVVEHLADPVAQFREVGRVLAPGGRFLFHTPNGTGYPTLFARAVPDAMRGVAARILEGREEGDRFHTFYRANTVSQIGAIADQTGFRVEGIDLLRSSAMFSRIIPLAVAELLFLRALAAPSLSWLRPNLIAVLHKSA